MTPPRTGHHLIVSRADKSRGLAAASGNWGTGKGKLLPFLLVRGAEAVELQTPCLPPPLPSGPPALLFIFSSRSAWQHRAPFHGLIRRFIAHGRALGIIDICEALFLYLEVGLSEQNHAMVDGNDEPGGEPLPDGWLKECRPRKHRHGPRIKGDMFYIDPVHGYEFRSLKDVYLYLQSGDISQCFKLPSKRKIEDLHSSGDPSHRTGRPSGYRHLDTANVSNQDGIGGIEPLRDSFISPEHVSSKPDNINSVQRESDQSEALEVQSIQFGSKEHTTGEAESVTRKGLNVEQRTKEKKRNAKPVKQMATPLRSSPRLAALRMSQEAINASRDGRTSMQTDITNQLQPKQVKNPRRKANSPVLPQKNDGPLTSSEKTDDNDSLVPNQIEVSAPCSSADVGCQNVLAGVPILPQVELGGTTAGMPGYALSSLFRHVWSDPCLQFAFRTLIGDIPVLNDSLATTNYFLPQPSMNKGATPNCSSSVYDGPRHHAQVDHVSLSLPRPSDKLYGSSWFPPQ